MLPSRPKSADVYGEFYRGKTLFVRASTADIETAANFRELTGTINGLVRNGVRIVLAYSGEGRIAEGLQGRGIPAADRRTADPASVWDAAAPVARDQRARIMDAFPMARHLRPEELAARVHPDHRVEAVDVGLQDGIPMTVVGYDGLADGREVCVHPDDVTLQIARQHHKLLHEVFLLSRSAGLSDPTGAPLPLLDNDGLDRMVAGKHAKITLTSEDRRRMLAVRKILPMVGKVALTSAFELKPELEEWSGGEHTTLVFHENGLMDSPLLPYEEPIFDAMYETHVRSGLFKRRDPAGLELLKRHHRMLRAKGSPIGGYSLYPHGGWHEISALWSSHIGGGVGRRLLGRAVEQARTLGTADSDTQVFALSNRDLIDLFREAGFAHHGDVRSAQAGSGDGIPPYALRYDTSAGRNPELFTYVERLANGSQ